MPAPIKPPPIIVTCLIAFCMVPLVENLLVSTLKGKDMLLDDKPALQSNGRQLLTISVLDSVLYLSEKSTRPT